MNLGSHWFRSFIFYLKTSFFSTPSLFTVSITISPYLIDPSDWWKMGGSGLSELVNGNDAEMTKQSMTNVGLLNLADTGESNGLNFNLVEAATCGIALVIGLFLLRWCCIKRKQRRMIQMQEALRAVTIDPHMARLPVLGAPPPPLPVGHHPPAAQLPPYPGKPTTEQLGAAIMQQYC